jgi:2',3'-cyclic-nucleotide 2'-phosphodiesterase (5'-nucleotidase family)
MSQRIVRILVLFLFLAATPFLFCEQKVLTILHTSDTHSCLFPLGPNDSLGGIARMSTLVKKLQARDKNVLTMHAGDVFVGTFEFNKYLGYPELKIMQGLYDTMALGNHEFDLGADTLTGILSGYIPSQAPITMPVLCANLDPLLAPSTLLALVRPNLIKDIGGIKVGIFGVVTVEPQNYSPSVLAFLTDPIAAAAAQVTELEAAGCEVIICLSHLGKMTDVGVLAPSVPGIDIIVGGHSHDALASPIIINDEIIVQAGPYGMFLGELVVKLKQGGGVELDSYKLHQVDWRIRKDPSLLWTLNMLRVGLVRDPRFGPVLSRFVARAAWDIEKAFPTDYPSYRDTAVGDLVSDAIKWGVRKAGFNVDAAMEALGYIGSKIYKGKIVGDDVMRTVPYGYDLTSGRGFKIVLVELTAAQIWGGLEYTLQYVPYTYDLSIMPSGLTFEYNSTLPAGSRLLWVKINNTLINPFDPVTKYRIAINEQVYNVLSTLDPSIAKTDTGLFEYNLVRDYLKKLIQVRYRAQGRVIDSAY